MRKVQLTYKFRLYPKEEHKEKLLETLEICSKPTTTFWLNGMEKKKFRVDWSFKPKCLR